MQKDELLAPVYIGFQYVFTLKHHTDKRYQLSFQEHAKEV
jgi:hypothetical protein